MTTRDLFRDHTRATINDVAYKAGVSTATVSRVINNTGSVAQKTREIVLTAIQELNYRPQSAAQVLASKKTNTIGLLLQQIGGEFFSPLLRSIERGASENGYNLLIYSTQDPPHNDSLLPIPVGEQNTDGLLVYVNSLNTNELQRLYRIGFPVVLIYQTPPKDLPIPSVTIENKTGARCIVDHLIEVHNYRRIAYLAGRIDQEDTYWREMGYRESLDSHGIAIDPKLIACGDFDRKQARLSVEAWLASGTEIDAVFAADDEMAIGVLAAFEHAGIRVPQDIALVGFDDMYLSQYLNPPLTTVNAPTEQVGRVAIQLLLQKIQGQHTDNLVLLPTELIIRQSCGCP